MGDGLIYLLIQEDKKENGEIKKSRLGKIIYGFRPCSSYPRLIGEKIDLCGVF